MRHFFRGGLILVPFQLIIIVTNWINSALHNNLQNGKYLQLVRTDLSSGSGSAPVQGEIGADLDH